MTGKRSSDQEFVMKTLRAMAETRLKRDSAIAEFERLRNELVSARLDGRLNSNIGDILKDDYDRLMAW